MRTAIEQKEYHRRYRLENLERYRASARKYRKLHKDRADKTTANWRKRNPDKIAAGRRRLRKKLFAEGGERLKRYGARRIVAIAVRCQLLKRDRCEVCGQEKVHAHHDDYAKPLAIRWFCLKHHQEHHKGILSSSLVAS